MTINEVSTDDFKLEIIREITNIQNFQWNTEDLLCTQLINACDLLKIEIIQKKNNEAHIKILQELAACSQLGSEEQRVALNNLISLFIASPVLTDQVGGVIDSLQDKTIKNTIYQRSLSNIQQRLSRKQIIEKGQLAVKRTPNFIYPRSTMNTNTNPSSPTPTTIADTTAANTSSRTTQNRPTISINTAMARQLNKPGNAQTYSVTPPVDVESLSPSLQSGISTLTLLPKKPVAQAPSFFQRHKTKIIGLVIGLTVGILISAFFPPAIPFVASLIFKGAASLLIQQLTCGALITATSSLAFGATGAAVDYCIRDTNDKSEEPETSSPALMQGPRITLIKFDNQDHNHPGLIPVSKPVPSNDGNVIGPDADSLQSRKNQSSTVRVSNSKFALNKQKSTTIPGMSPIEEEPVQTNSIFNKT